MAIDLKSLEEKVKKLEELAKVDGATEKAVKEADEARKAFEKIRSLKDAVPEAAASTKSEKALVDKLTADKNVKEFKEKIDATKRELDAKIKKADSKELEAVAKAEKKATLESMEKELEGLKKEVKTAKTDLKDATKEVGKAKGKEAAASRLDTTEGGEASKKLRKSIKEAEKAGTVDGKSFSGTLPKEKLSWWDRIRGAGSDTKRAVSSEKLESKLSKLGRLENSLERAKTYNMSTEKLEKQITEVRSEIETEAKKLFPAMSEAKVARQEAIEAIEKQRSKAIEKSEKQFRDAIKDADKKQRPRLEKELEAEQKALNNKFDKAVKAQNKQIEKIGDIEAQIEKHTGLKGVDHLNTKSLSSAAAAGNAEAKSALATEKGIIGGEYAKKSAPGKLMAAAEYQWKSGGLGKAKVALGSIIGLGLGYSGVKDIKDGVMGAQDEMGNELPTDGKLFTGVAKLGGAALAVWAALAGAGKGAAGKSLA